MNTRSFWYELPPDRIATHPVTPRDHSRLLIYKDGKISHHRFHELTESLPKGALLVFNDTRVIPARLFFKNPNGAQIEVMLLSPVSPSTSHEITLRAEGLCRWACAIGNLKRWKSGTVLTSKLPSARLEAHLVDPLQHHVEFRWDPRGIQFCSVLEQWGHTPLPPYIKRAEEEEDRVRYQTIFSAHDGAVAAPTAGLHFTKETLESLRSRGIDTAAVTLHVGAGTFLPVKTEDPMDHTMHREYVVVPSATIDKLLDQTFVVPVGTTSVRTLESLYWYGARLMRNGDTDFEILQDEPGRHSDAPPARTALERIKAHMEERKLDSVAGNTALYIHPGYAFRFCDALITNFHQPGSTLLMLVAAHIGETWRPIYEDALVNGYRFLSYGDAMLLFRPKTAI